MTFDDFKKNELRVGRVVFAERVQGSEKLLRLEVNLGEKNEADLPITRQIVAGIGNAYVPDDLLNKNIVIVANLEPRKLMGLESNGMLLAAHDDDGNPILLTIDGKVSPGSSIG